MGMAVCYMRTMAIKLWKHQIDAIARAKDLDYFALLQDAGIGKSLTAIKILEDKIEKEGRYLRTLILTPSVVVETWKREFSKYSTIPTTHVIPLYGNTGDRAAKYLENSWPTVFITNYEALYSSFFMAALKTNPPEVIILDESHRCKDPKAKRTKACLDLATRSKYRYILTGTAVLNSAMDLFTQIKFLDGGQALGTNYYIFRAQYFEDKNRARAGTHGYFPKWALRPGVAKHIAAQIAPISIRTKKEDALDLPPLTRQTLFVDLNAEQLKAYKDMKKDFIAFIGDKASSASIALTKALRLQQIVSGFIKFEDGSIQSFENTPRIFALTEQLEELTKENKVIVWAVFKENYTQIIKVCEDLNLKYAQVHGDITDKDEQVQRFCKDPTVKVMIAHPGAGGIGINLIEAAYSIWFSRNFSLEQDIQATARNYRGGSEMHSNITRIDLVTKDTIDEVVLEVLKEKSEHSEELLSNVQVELLSRITKQVSK